MATGSAAFFVGDMLLNPSKPSSATLGLARCKAINQGPLYASGKEPGTGTPGAPLLSVVTTLVSATTEPYVVFDIENGISDADYALTLAHAKTVRPDALFSAYDYLPRLSGNAGLLFGVGHANFDAWQAQNDAAYAAMGQYLDFFAPSFGYWRNGREQWQYVGTSAHISEARRLDPDKPVYSWVWWQFHDIITSKSGTYIPAHQWRKYLRFLHTGDMTGINKGAFWDASFQTDGIDGVFLWDNLVNTWGSSNPLAESWAETQLLIAEIAATVPPALFRVSA